MDSVLLYCCLMATMAVAISRLDWRMDEFKALIGEFTQAVTRRMDDHDILIELKVTSQNTLNQVNMMVIELEKNYVTRDQFEPIRKMVYGVAAAVFMAVLGAILSLVVRK